MQRTETKSPGLAGYAILGIASMLSWMMFVPRTIASLLTSTLDLLENVVLTLLWEYQGEARLSYWPLNSKPQTRSQVVQTDAAMYEKDKQEHSLTKLIDDTVPLLLEALQRMPCKAEIGNMLSQQTDLTSDMVARTHTQLLDNLQQRIVEADRSVHIEKAVYELAYKVDAAQKQLVKMQNGGSKTACVDEHIYNALIGDFRSSMQQHQANSNALSQLNNRVADIEAMLAKSAYAKQASDVAVATDDADTADQMAGSTDTVHNDSNSEKTIERVHNPNMADSYKLLQRSSSTSSAKSRRLSSLRRLKRYPLFGKRPTS
ncbi:hypothetical protein IWW36_002600 [Coemansia brasiliensis]|uniref:Uncharacterized protein n=1 Tax=Coemansia brasiliensis TaxID=2650707 RepID=A0A9W8M0V6_9FUNG|nr:hypothetical protein IWW36_002600 [Coemansia brasiliensis]